MVLDLTASMSPSQQAFPCAFGNRGKLITDIAGAGL